MQSGQMPWENLASECWSLLFGLRKLVFGDIKAVPGKVNRVC
jgi:hypothetical protein